MPFIMQDALLISIQYSSNSGQEYGDIILYIYIYFKWKWYNSAMEQVSLDLNACKGKASVIEVNIDMWAIV